MTQTLHEFVLAELEASKGRWTEVADGAGVSKRTLEKIARREIEDPGVSHIEKLAAYFREQRAA
jgi:transcriptional regulator with XRE-family HTH domain